MMENTQTYRIGLFFGSFDPMHVGHLNIVEKCLDAGIVNGVNIIPAWQNPFKSSYTTTYDERILMCNFAIVPLIKKHRNVFVDNIEGKLAQIHGEDKPILTYDVLQFKEFVKTSNVEYVIICGDDVFTQIPTWFNGDAILNNYKFIVFSRDLKDKIEHPSIIHHLETNGYNDVSSSKIREMIKNSEDVSPYLTNLQMWYIDQANIYKSQDV